MQDQRLSDPLQDNRRNPGKTGYLPRRGRGGNGDGEILEASILPFLILNITLLCLG